MRDRAHRIAAKSPLLRRRLGKDAIASTRDMSLPDALAALRSQLALAFTTEDVAEDVTEGVTVFREKRTRPGSSGEAVIDVHTQAVDPGLPGLRECRGSFPRAQWRRSPLRLSGSATQDVAPAPRLGEHTTEVLDELLGIDDW